MQPKQVRREGKLDFSNVEVHPDVIELISGKIAKASETLVGLCVTEKDYKEANVFKKKYVDYKIEKLHRKIARLTAKLEENTKTETLSAKSVGCETIVSEFGMVSKIISSIAKFKTLTVDFLSVKQLRVGTFFVSAEKGIERLSAMIFQAKKIKTEELEVNHIDSDVTINEIDTKHITVDEMSAENICVNTLSVKELDVSDVDADTVITNELHTDTIRVEKTYSRNLNGYSDSVLKQVFDMPNKSKGILTIGSDGIQSDDTLLNHNTLSNLGDDAHKQYATATRDEKSQHIFGCKYIELSATADSPTVRVLDDVIKAKDLGLEVKSIDCSKYKRLVAPKYDTTGEFAMTEKNDGAIALVGASMYYLYKNEAYPFGGGPKTISLKMKLKANEPTVINSANIRPRTCSVAIKDIGMGYRVVNDCVLECNNKIEVTVRKTSSYHITITGV